MKTINRNLLTLALVIFGLYSVVQGKPDGDETPTELEPAAEPNPDAPSSTPAPVIMKELATGKRIDVRHHPNIQILPTIQECGFSAKEDGVNGKAWGMRMFTGRSTGSGKFPWMIRIVNEDSKGMRSTGCAGTIISSRYILTTASCLVGMGYGTHASNIILGGPGSNCENAKCSTISKIVDIDEIVIHSDFVYPTRQHNIGLIKLKKDIIFENFVRPVCLPLSEAFLGNWKNNKTTVVGWTKLDETSNKGSLTSHMLYPRNVQSAEMILELRDYCNRFYRRSHANFGPGRICASGDSSKSACTEDDGGPALKSIHISELGQDRFYQFGIVSFQHKLCGQPGIPGGFTNVINYMPWILDNLSLV